MRYLPTTNAGDRFAESRRPALDKIPPSLADKLRERDRIAAQRTAARNRVAELGTEQATEAATQTDNEAAAKAARAGKPIPAPVALPKLEEQRAKAAHAVQAQEAAFVTIDSESEYLASELFWSSLEAQAAARADARAEIGVMAASLADAVEAAVDRFAVADWQRGRVYDTSAQTWPTEVIDLDRHGLRRLDVSPIKVRDVIIAAATTCLDEPDHPGE
jgi:hypothetical protein